jgi:hypothetical protein
MSLLVESCSRLTEDSKATEAYHPRMSTNVWSVIQLATAPHPDVAVRMSTSC